MAVKGWLIYRNIPSCTFHIKITTVAMWKRYIEVGYLSIYSSRGKKLEGWKHRQPCVCVMQVMVNVFLFTQAWVWKIILPLTGIFWILQVLCALYGHTVCVKPWVEQPIYIRQGQMCIWGQRSVGLMMGISFLRCYQITLSESTSPSM